MNESKLSKPELRRIMRQRRQAVPQAQRDSAASCLATNVAALPGWESATKIALYLASDGEADPCGILTALRHSGRTPYLPVIQEDKSLLFAPWRESAPLVANRFGIMEPQEEGCTAGEMEIILLPIVAWDSQGHRLGMGGGYYDRSLADQGSVTKVGLALELQKVEKLVTEPWDIRLDFIATETALIPCQGQS